jgi:hypothetical protein
LRQNDMHDVVLDGGRVHDRNLRGESQRLNLFYKRNKLLYNNISTSTYFIILHDHRLVLRDGWVNPKNCIRNPKVRERGRG